MKINTITTEPGHDVDPLLAAEQAATEARASAQAAVDLMRPHFLALKAEEAKLMARSAELYDTPLSVPELKQFLGELIDLRAKNYLKRMTQESQRESYAEYATFPQRTKFQAYAPFNFEDAEYTKGRRRADEVPPREDRINASGWEFEPFRMLGNFEGWPYLLLGDLMKAKLNELLGEGAGSPNGLTLDARRAEVNAIGERLAVIRSQCKRIVWRIRALDPAAAARLEAGDTKPQASAVHASQR